MRGVEGALRPDAAGVRTLRAQRAHVHRGAADAPRTEARARPSDRGAAAQSVGRHRGPRRRDDAPLGPTHVLVGRRPRRRRRRRRRPPPQGAAAARARDGHPGDRHARRRARGRAHAGLGADGARAALVAALRARDGDGGERARSAHGVVLGRPAQARAPGVQRAAAAWQPLRSGCPCVKA